MAGRHVMLDAWSPPIWRTHEGSRGEGEDNGGDGVGVLGAEGDGGDGDGVLGADGNDAEGGGGAGTADGLTCGATAQKWRRKK